MVRKSVIFFQDKQVHSVESSVALNADPFSL